MKIVKQNEGNDIYRELMDDIIWCENLKAPHVEKNLYEYLKANFDGLEMYEKDPMSEEYARKNQLPQWYYRIFILTQKGVEENCIISSRSGIMKCLPIKATNILKTIEAGLKPTQEIMSFTMEVPENGDTENTWCFTKQIVNCIGAFEEIYKPLKKQIEVVFCPIEEYERIIEEYEKKITYEYPQTKKTPWSEAQQRNITSRDEFVSFPIRIGSAL